MILKKAAFTLFLCGGVLLSAAVAQAQQPTTTGGNNSSDPKTACDPEYMDALESRAWLEAQREITQNQNLISKPDSVLEYTCFNSFLNHLAKNFNVSGVKRLFSETDNWGGHPPGINDTSTDTTLDNVVRQSMKSYLERNFKEKFIGDRLDEDYAGSSNGPEEQVSGKDYTCDRMAKVWEMARCLNFMQKPDQDGFFDFPWYAENDPRKLPGTMVACTPPQGSGSGGGSGGGQSQGQNLIKDLALPSAFNKKQDTYTMETTGGGGGGGGSGGGAMEVQEPFTDDTPYKEDKIVTNLDKIKPGSCGHSIKTGITVSRDGQNFDEIVCTNPACAASSAGGQCSTTVQTPGGGGGG